MKYLPIVCLGIIVVVINHSCAAYEYIYDQDDSDLRWLYDNQLYGRNFDFNSDFDDYVPNSYRKSVHYPPIVSYHPSAYYVDDTGSQFDDQWNDGAPVYLPYETLPRVQKKPVYFAPPTTERPSNDGYHYPAPEIEYLPPSKEPVPFAPSKKPDVPKTVYLPPKSVYLPPTRKPTTSTPKTTVRTTTTLKPSTPKSLYLPPIVVAEPKQPKVIGEYLPPPRELAHHLQPPPVSAAKPIMFN